MSYEPQFTIHPRLRELIRQASSLQEKLKNSHLRPDFWAMIRYRTSVESVHSSTAIEGNPLNFRQVQTVMSGQQCLAPSDYAALEVRGYQRALEYITTRARQQPEIEIADLLALHQLITAGLLDVTRSGHFRRHPVYIENSQHHILYTGAPPAIVEDEVAALLAWLNEKQFILNPIIIAGLIHLQLVAIHPFADGNGRTARALTALFLAIQDCNCSGSLTLDSYYASDRAAYYHNLQQTQGKNYDQAKNADVTDWLTYFVTGFLSSLHILQAEIKILQTSLPPASLITDQTEQLILDFAAKFNKITTSQVQLLAPHMDRRALQRRLHHLVEAGYLRLEGQGRGHYYVLSP